MEEGVNPDLDYLLDPQQARTVCMCVNCGREVYASGKNYCEKCEEDGS